ncbi:putative membrane protein [Escherichia coli 2-177-06_S1_C1]|nr:putative membrane protein [Escherichia coli 2-005-03_S1_C1]KDA65132.1 putative membrane protein [Escherichia coli 2-052-05_S1_C1]KDW25346.1 putative membrane protein [Escherichia coli 2-177-06_S1_C1]KDW36996.1 putative membrane protein [Escherichia coli 2-177-06_S1_C2]KDW44648.1 putative membrane protein [Escherichia coli 2-177-06_S1_C3]
MKKANIALLSYFSLNFYVGITQGLIINYIEFKPVLDV